MLRVELKKYAGKLLFLFVLFGIGYLVMLIINHASIEMKTRQYYKEYMALLEGPLNSEKEVYIADEYSRVNAYIEWTTESIQNGANIDMDKLYYALEHEKAWKMVYDRYVNLIQLGNEEDRIFYDDLDLQDYFKGSSINYLEIFLLVIISLYAVTSDFHDGRHVIIKTTYKGNTEYILTKQNALICMAVFIAVSFSITELIYLIIRENVSILSMPIKSMCDFSSLKWSISVGEYILLRGINHMIWCIVTVLVMGMVALLIKRLQTALFIGLFTIVIPIALRGILNKGMLVWIYSIHLDKDFSLCNYGIKPIGIAMLMTGILYGINSVFWRTEKCNSDVR